MNHLDFVLWVVGWGFLIGLDKRPPSWANVIWVTVWIAVAVALWRAG